MLDISRSTISTQQQCWSRCFAWRQATAGTLSAPIGWLPLPDSPGRQSPQIVCRPHTTVRGPGRPGQGEGREGRWEEEKLLTITQTPISYFPSTLRSIWQDLESLYFFTFWPPHTFLPLELKMSGSQSYMVHSDEMCCILSGESWYDLSQQLFCFDLLDFGASTLIFGEKKSNETLSSQIVKSILL